MIKLFKVSIFIIIGFNSIAQDLISLEDAIKMAIEKNYDILISKTGQEIAKTQNNRGNAGMSPQVNLNAALTGANLDSYQEFGNGTVQDRKGAQSLNANAAMQVSWTIFDGMKMFAVKTRLNTNEKIAELQYKQQLEQTIQAVILAYYDIVRIQQLTEATLQNLDLLKERKKLINLRYQIGSDSKVDFLLVQTDENKAQSELLRLKQQLLTAKTNLNSLLNKSSENDFSVLNVIPLMEKDEIEKWRNSMLSKNTSLLLAKQNEISAETFVKEARSEFLPQINLAASYNFLRNQTEAGFVLLNRQTGINGGLTAGWTIFNGNKTSKLVQERKLNALRMRYFTEKSTQLMQATAFVQFKQYGLSEALLKLEEANLKSAEELLMISDERYKTGKTGVLETKETQKILEEAKVRLINARFELKKAEIELMLVAGELVKQ